MDQGSPHPSTSPASSNKINSLLCPIFDTIRENNISSYFQLKKLENPQPTSNSTISKGGKLTPLHARKQKMSKTLDFFHKDPINEEAIGQERPKKKTPSKTKKELKKVPSYSANSKIKRHLVHEIDYDEIEKMLYKKREWVTRYELFFDQLQNRKKHAQEKKHKSKREAHSPEVPSEAFQNLATITMRTTPKKKFWLHEKRKTSNQSKELTNAVEGKSIIKVSNLF